MKNIKKLLIYPLAFVLFFGLTANECLDSLGEDILPNIDIPIENNKTVTLKFSQEEVDAFEENGTIVYVELDLNDPQLDEYRDQIESAKLSQITFTLRDLLEGGSARVQGNVAIVFDPTSDFDENMPLAFTYSKGYVLFQNFEDISVFDGEVYTGSDFVYSYPTLDSFPEPATVEEFEKSFIEALENETEIGIIYSVVVDGPVHYEIDAVIETIATVNPNE